MAGISDEAAKTNYPENKYRFQKQELQNKEFSDGSGLEWYEFKYRMDDPQIGRFGSIDPLANKYVYNSPYAFSEDKVTNNVELEGLEAAPPDYAGAMAQAHLTSPDLATQDMVDKTVQAQQIANAATAKAVPGMGVLLTAAVNPLAAVPLALGYITGLPVTPSPQALAGSEIGAGASGVSDETAALLNRRANDIQSVLNPVTQTKVTTAVGLVTASDGTNVTLVASSEKVLRPAQIAALQPGEIAVSGVGHAEATIMNYADKTGMAVQAVAASRPICTSCAVSITSGGAQAVTQYKNPAEAIAAINAFNASLPIPLTSN